MLMPTDDEYVIVLSQNKAELEERYIVAVDDWHVTREIINKDALYPAAQKIGVPTPAVWFPRSAQELQATAKEISYPCILKPIESHIFSRAFGVKNFMAYNPEELMEKFALCEGARVRVMVSEIIPGEDSAIFSYRSYIDKRGDLLAEMCTQKLRQYPPMFGRGSVVRTIPMNRKISELALRLLRALSLRGFSSTEFKLDFRDNQLKLMEVNLRPVSTSWLFIAAGVNFPYITYMDLVEDVRISVPSYTEDLYWINQQWELVNMWESLKRGDFNIGEFAEIYGRKRTFPVSFADDPVHFTMEAYSVCRKALGRLWQTAS
jgi:D-aspartate ligase